MNCAQCGGEVPATQTYCPSCGNPIGLTTPMPVSPSAAPPPAYEHLGLPHEVPRFIDPVSGVTMAEWWQRAVALLLDTVAVAIPALIAFFALVAVGRTTTTIYSSGIAIGTSSSTSGLFIFLGFAVGVVIWFGYYVYCTGSERGQTLGKRALGIAVCDESGSGSIGYARAAARYGIIAVLDVLFSILVVVDYLWPLWDQRRQAWHDKVARSLVVAAP